LIAAIKERAKKVNKAVKELKKLQEERDSREQELRLAADREIAHLQEAAADLCRIFNDPDEARRYFAVVDKAEIEENEFNLNLPRYVDTFEPEKVVPLNEAIQNLRNSRNECTSVLSKLDQLLADLQQ
jgi:type I restriction enzyme M protein